MLNLFNFNEDFVFFLSIKIQVSSSFLHFAFIFKKIIYARLRLSINKIVKQ